MKSIVRAVLATALLCSVSAFAQQPPACPSVQWTDGQTVPLPNVSTHLRYLATVDYDEDGLLDAVGVIDENMSRSLAWWKGAGDNTFGAPTILRSNFWFSNIVVADATGDGLDDVIVGSTGPNLIILPATGSGRGPVIEQFLPFSPSGIATMNRDDDPEVELAAAGGGARQFGIYDDIATTITEVAGGTTERLAMSIGSADFDDDGNFDVVVGSFWTDGHSLDVYYGRADETLEPPVALPNTFLIQVLVADVNEDGRPDLVGNTNVTNNTWPQGLISIYRNDGARNFTRSVLLMEPPGVGVNVNSMLVADVSGDGHLDLIATMGGGGTVTATALGVGDGTFRTPTFLSTAPFALALGDLDDDGAPELLGGDYAGVTSWSASCLTQVSLDSVSPVISAGQDAELDVLVSGFAADTPSPRGTITLRDGDAILDTASVGADGRVSFTISSLALGEHPLTAEFSGNAAVPLATSEIVTQKVTSATTQTTITIPDGPTTYGTPFPIDIDIHGAGYDYVTVNLDGVLIEHHYTGSPLILPLEPGTHTVSAKYFGSMYYPPSESETVYFTIDKASPSIGTSGALVVRQGSAHALTFTVDGEGALPPGGSVQLIEGTSILGTVAIVDGAASFNLTLTRGAHDVRVFYTGDARYLSLGFDLALEVLPNVPLFIEARGMTDAMHIAYVVPADTNLNSLQLLRRPAGTGGWSVVAGWDRTTGWDATVPSRGVVYEYQLTGSLNGGSPIASNIESALLFTDDALAFRSVIKRVHFTELRTAVNLMRAQAGLTPFAFDASFDSSAIVRASHVTGLQTALTQARQQLGMSTPSLKAVSAGKLIRTSEIQQMRDLAR